MLQLPRKMPNLKKSTESSKTMLPRNWKKQKKRDENSWKEKQQERNEFFFSFFWKSTLSFSFPSLGLFLAATNVTKDGKHDNKQDEEP